MNDDIFGGKWKQFRGELRKQWGKLTDDELEQAKGNTEKLLGLVQERYGTSKAEVLARYNDMVDAFRGEAEGRQAPPPPRDPAGNRPASHDRHT